MTSSISSSASPLIQLFHNQLFDELEAHRLKNLAREDQAEADVQGEDLGNGSNRNTGQADLPFAGNQ